MQFSDTSAKEDFGDSSRVHAQLADSLSGPCLFIYIILETVALWL